MTTPNDMPKTAGTRGSIRLRTADIIAGMLADISEKGSARSGVLHPYLDVLPELLSAYAALSEVEHRKHMDYQARQPA